MPIIAIYALIATAIFAAGAGAGWSVNGWRNGSEIEQLRSREAVAMAANTKCVADIDDVRAGVRVITDAVAARETAASTEMRKARVAAAKHTAAAKEMYNAPPVIIERQRQAIEQEQVEYVAARHAAE